MTRHSTGHAPICADLPRPVRYWPSLLLSFALCVLAGCNGNYTFNDSAYRPLGDPQMVNRGK